MRLGSPGQGPPQTEGEGSRRRGEARDQRPGIWGSQLRQGRGPDWQDRGTRKLRPLERQFPGPPPSPRPIPPGGLLPWELLSRQRAPGHGAAGNEAGQGRGGPDAAAPRSAREGAAGAEARREGSCVGSFWVPLLPGSSGPEATWELVSDADSQGLPQTC